MPENFPNHEKRTQSPQQSTQSQYKNPEHPSESPPPPFDKERLNRIHQECSDPKHIYGREVVLEEADFRAVEQVLDAARELVDRAIRETVDWPELQARIKDSIRETGFRPEVLDGGDRFSVLKPPAYPHEVFAPTQAFQAHQWQGVIEATRTALVLARMNSGASTHPLSTNLAKIAFLLRENRLL